MDVTRDKLINLIEEGKVDAAEFLPKFINVLKDKTETGLAPALNKTFTAAGRLKNAFLSFVDVLFRSGVDKLFGTILNILTRMFTIAKPFVALFGSAFFTILRNLLTPLELILTIIASIIKGIGYLVEQATGVGFFEVLQNLGTVLGHLFSFAFGAITKIVSKTGELLKSFTVIGKFFEGIKGIWDDIVGNIAKVIKMVPWLDGPTKGVAKAGRKISEKAKNINPEHIEYTARGGAAINALRSGGQAVQVHINKKDGTDDLIDAQVQGGTSGKLDRDSRE